jgi:chromosome segregation ATPase
MSAARSHDGGSQKATRLERQLRDVSARLKQTREELNIATEQLAVFRDQAEEARVRSLVSETPIAEQEYRENQRHAQVMERHHAELTAQAGRLDDEQSGLLDRLAAVLRESEDV